MIPIDKSAVMVPAILDPGHPANKSVPVIRKLEKAHDSGQVKFEFDSDLYGHKTVKDALVFVQHGKCCFCESDVRHIAHGDVEHYRPKGGVQIDENAPLTQPGYYWLAYDFDNLFFSCQICNQSYKKNFFPLADETKRARSHHDAAKIADETPLIVNPALDQPAVHIFFNREIPIGIDQKGELTIRRIGLDRDQLNKHRLKYLRLLDRLAHHAKNGDRDSLQLLKEAARPNQEYSLMVQCNFSSLL